MRKRLCDTAAHRSSQSPVMLTRTEPVSAPQPLIITAEQDLVQGLANWQLWGRLGWFDVKRRYRRTMIGPFWSAISVAIYSCALGLVGAGLWHQNLHDYLPFLVAGLIVWMLVSTIINESCVLFVNTAHLSRQIRFDYSLLAYALLWRNLIVFLHHFVVYALIVLLFARNVVGAVTLLMIPGLLLVLANGIWVVILLGLLCLRFRDLQQVIINLVSVSMFVTPIFWPPDSLVGARRALFVDLNPFFHIIDVVRAPLLGHVPALETYLWVLAMAVVGWSLMFLLFRRFRRRVAYWS
jgi:homopolymeric O-antigen transport system permease protein